MNPFEDRFWQKVVKGCPDQCWPWIGATNRGSRNEYGSILRNGKMIGAHRASWEINHGTIAPGMCVLHRCDNPRCVNPAHLFLGTHAENMIDKASKGRAPRVRGANHQSAKLTQGEVYAIRAAHGTQMEIAKRFHISQSHVQRIRTNQSWSDL